MACCLNPDCQNPLNPDSTTFCLSCGTKLVLLRGRYRIIQPLGGGGFGRTYLAEDVDKLDAQCVVKQLAPQVQGSSALQKATDLFKQEAQRLQHLGEHPKYNGKFKNTLLVGGAILLLGLVGTQIYEYFRYKLFPSNPIFLITSLPSSIFLERSLTGHSYSVNCVAISPDGQTLVSGSADKTIKIWRVPK